MKKVIWILIGFVLLTGVGLYWANSQLKGIVETDLEFNTIYSSGFDQSNFNKIKSGIKTVEVEELIGEPLNSFIPEYYHSIVYSNFNVEITAGSGNAVSILDTAKNITFLKLTFNQDGKVIGIFNRNFLNEENESKIADNYENLIQELGQPKQEIRCNCSCKVLNYSNLKDGPYTGKRPLINIRRITIDEQSETVKSVVNMVGNPYSEYYGLCN